MSRSCLLEVYFLATSVHCEIILWWTFIKAGNKRPGVSERRGLSLHLDFVRVLAAGAERNGRDGSGKRRRASVKSHCDYECNCSSGAQGPCSSDGAGRCFAHSNREKEKWEWEEVGRVGGGGRLPGRIRFLFYFIHHRIFSSNSSLLPSSPLPPTFSLTSPPLFSCSPPSSSLGRISRVSLEGKCNNALTRWNRARSIISREMDGPCRAGGGQARTQFRFNKLAKQDPQSDSSLTRRQCLLLRRWFPITAQRRTIHWM